MLNKPADMALICGRGVLSFLLPVLGHLTLKKVMVEPPCMVPYSMAVWSARSSTDSMGTSILCTVRKAARLAVYEEMMIKVKAHLE